MEKAKEKITKESRLLATIAFYKKLYKVKNDDLRKYLGISPTTLYHKMKTADFSFKELVIMSELFCISAGELIDGQRKVG